MDGVPRHVMAKGNYFKYSGKSAFSRLIYPAPVPGGPAQRADPFSQSL